MTPKISVVVPAYNAERTIKETIESVQKQTFSDFELIVINDGSTDRTLELLQSIKEPRLRILSYENGGLPVARNRGIANATGEFIAFLDADDLWTLNKLELQLEALQQHPEAGVAYSWTYYIDEQGKSLFPGIRIFYEGNVHADLLLRNFLLNGSNPLIRRQAIEAVGEFDSTLKSGEDWDFYLRLAASWSFVLVPKYQVLYRQSSTSMSSKVNVMKEANLIVLKRAFQVAPSELQYLRNRSFSIFHQYLAELYFKHSIDRSGIQQTGENLWIAIRLNPQTLFNKDTQRILIKFLLRWVFPSRLSPDKDNSYSYKARDAGFKS
jgi:glycosyltransferase involved in cell wall biosynthesis